METKDIDLEKYEIISFDIFDTLIKRKYSTPKGVFEHISAIIKDPTFTEKRIKAEIKARKISKKQDITIDDIYNQLPQEYTKCKEEEKLLEINNSFANLEIKNIYDQAVKLNKKIIATSDMYLDEKTITTLLNTAGYNHLHKIYISGVYGKLKWSGDLYKIIIKDLGIEPQKILHIGDNYRADCVSAKKIGITAVHYQEKNFLKDKKFTKFNTTKNLEKSCLFALCNEYYKNNDDYFKRLGFVYGGPLCLSFLKWVYSQVKNKQFSDMLFISRDGWILKKVFDLLYPNEFKTHYIYASREVCKNVDHNEYKKYLEKQNITGDKIALVDTVANYYTAHRFLQQFFTNKITGFYFRIMRENHSLTAFKFENKAKIYNCDFIEFLITSPEYPIKNIKNGKIIFEENNIYENYRKDAYLKVSTGIIDFIREYKNIYKREFSQIDNLFVIYWINNLFFYLNKEDMKNFSSIYHTMGHRFQDYYPAIPKPFCLLFKFFSLFPFAHLWSKFFYFNMRVVNKLYRISRKLAKKL